MNKCKNCDKDIPDKTSKNKPQKYCCLHCGDLYNRKKRLRMKPLIVYDRNNESFCVCQGCKRELKVTKGELICECGNKYNAELMYYITKGEDGTTN